MLPFSLAYVYFHILYIISNLYFFCNTSLFFTFTWLSFFYSLHHIHYSIFSSDTIFLYLVMPLLSDSCHYFQSSFFSPTHLQFLYLFISLLFVYFSFLSCPSLSFLHFPSFILIDCHFSSHFSMHTFIHCTLYLYTFICFLFLSLHISINVFSFQHNMSPSIHSIPYTYCLHFLA